MILLRVVVFAAGLLLVIATLVSVIRSIVLPRGAPEALSRAVFVFVRSIFLLRMRWMHSFDEKDRLMALFAPVAVLLLLPVWLALVLFGYAGMFWAVGVSSPLTAIRESGSSLLTLGFVPVEGMIQAALAFSEAAIGLILVALLIAYLPSMYAAFARRGRRSACWKCAPGLRPARWR